MTLQRACDLLHQRLPGRSFCITLSVWHHKHAPPGPDVGWAIYDAEEREHYEGATLEAAMEACLGCDSDLAAVERQIDTWGATPVSDHERLLSDQATAATKRLLETVDRVEGLSP